MGLGWVTGSWGLSSPQCAAAFDDLSFPTECVAEVVGQTLNYVILAGSLVVRLPQIITIFKAQSISGISEASVLVEALSSWLFVIYNLLQRHSFKTWGEALFIGIQNLLLLVLYCRLARPELSKQLQGHCTRAAAALAFLFFACKQQLLPPRAQQIITRLLGASPLPLMVLSRAPQIVKNRQQEHTGHLSLLSLSLNVVGGFARLFTVLQQVPDHYVLVSCSAALILNMIPALQIVYYWKETIQVLQREADRKDS